MPQIYISVEGGTTVTLEVDLALDTVANVKTKVRDKEGIPVEQQQLSFKGETLEDGSILMACGIAAEDMLSLTRIRDEIQVTVQRASGEPLALTMRLRDTAGDVKQKIEETESIPVARQWLYYLETRLEDRRGLSQLQTRLRPWVNLRLEIRINITLQLYTGMSIPMEIASDEPIDTIQNMVHTRGHIPYHLQQSTYGEQVMEYGLRVSDYGVQDGAVVNVSLRNYEVMVFIKTLTGRTIMVRVTPSDTVSMVKDKIEQQEGISAERQRLIFVGEQLHDHRRLLDYRIEHESALHLVYRSGDGFQIFVQVGNGRSMVFEVQPNDTISSVKVRVREREGIPLDLQELFLDGTKLENASTIRDCGVAPNGTLNLVVDHGRNTQVFIALHTGETLSMWVNPEETVLRLKELISNRKDIPVDIQEIYFARVHLINERTLNSYTIENNHMLHLEISTPPVLHLLVRMRSGKELSLEEPANQTVESVKSEVHRREGIPVSEQQLFFGGSELDNGRTLNSYEVKDGSVLDLIPFVVASPATTPTGMLLFVKTLTGKTLTVNIDPLDTIRDLKNKIKEKEGLPISQQCLVAAGKQLDNNLPVSTCNIQNQSVLHLVLRVPSHGPVQITVVGVNGKDLQFDLTLGDTIEAVKERIQTQEGIPSGQQTLLFNGERLDEDRTLASYDVTDGATLRLEYPQAPH